MLVFLPFASSLESLPTAILAAIVIGAVGGLVRLRAPLRLWRYSRPQFVVAWGTFAATLALAPNIAWAVLIGVGLAIALHLWRELQLEVQSWVEGDVLHLRPRGVLWFGTARRLEDLFIALVADNPRVQKVEIHLDALGRIDTTGALTLRTRVEEARSAGLEVGIVDVRERWRGLVARVIEDGEDPLTKKESRR